MRRKEEREEEEVEEREEKEAEGSEEEEEVEKDEKSLNKSAFMVCVYVCELQPSLQKETIATIIYIHSQCIAVLHSVLLTC